MVFTKTDKTLLDRAARLLHDQAVIEEKIHGPIWVATAEGKEGKKRFDRLLRDERDMRALAKRLVGDVGHAEYPLAGPAVALTTGTGEG